MKKMKHLVVSACILLVLGACTKGTMVTDISILPFPDSIRQEQGNFILPKECTISITDSTLAPAAEYLLDMLSVPTGYNMKLVKGKKGTIVLSVDEIGGKDGAYILDVKPDRVQVTGNSYRGVLAGISSLRQLFPHQIEQKQVAGEVEWKLPVVFIKDAPRFEWRGFMLDVVRHFYTKEEIKEVLDVMALYKMNKFHWHLTDDQGWRIEIRKYPLLVKKGAWRNFISLDVECMNLAKTEDNADFLIPEDRISIINGDTLYGGFYTQDDIREVVDYARIRGIDVIPEIDIPGHMLSAITAYPEMSCFGKVGAGSIPICPGKSTPIEFCKDIYCELFELFPYEYVHIGGDEVSKNNWKKCPDCQKRIRDNKLVTEDALQSWFTYEIEKFCNEKGKKIIGWDDIIKGGLSRSTTVMWWQSTAGDNLAQAINQGNQIIFTPTGQFYLDYEQNRNSVRNIYNFEFPQDSLVDESQTLLKGVQGNLWTEWIPSRERLYYMAFPRLLAIAELGWSNPLHKDWEAFSYRLSEQLERLKIMNIPYRIPDVTGFYETNVFIDKMMVHANCPEINANIHYTTDGTMPTLQSPQYEKPVKITETTNFKFCTFSADGRKGEVIQTRFIKDQYEEPIKGIFVNSGLEAVCYEFEGDNCIDIEKSPVKGVYSVSNIMIPEAVEGKVGIIIKGFLNIPAGDIYTFTLSTDDNSLLIIDGKEIVNNEKQQRRREVIREVSGQKALKKGHHSIEVRYWGMKNGALKMKMTDSKGLEIPL